MSSDTNGPEGQIPPSVPQSSRTCLSHLPVGNLTPRDTGLGGHAGVDEGLWAPVAVPVSDQQPREGASEVLILVP